MKHLKARLSLLLIIALSTLLMGCQPNGKVHQFQAVNTQGWNNTDTLTFLLPPDTLDTLRQLSIEARIMPQYPYTELWLVVEQQLLNDSIAALSSAQDDTTALASLPIETKTASVLFSDTVRMQIADDKGNFLGTGRNILQYDYPLGALRLSPSDTLRLTIRHIMHDTHLVGVHDIGIHL